MIGFRPCLEARCFGTDPSPPTGETGFSMLSNETGRLMAAANAHLAISPSVIFCGGKAQEKMMERCLNVGVEVFRQSCRSTIE